MDAGGLDCTLGVTAVLGRGGDACADAAHASFVDFLVNRIWELPVGCVHFILYNFSLMKQAEECAFCSWKCRWNLFAFGNLFDSRKNFLRGKCVLRILMLFSYQMLQKFPETSQIFDTSISSLNASSMRCWTLLLIFPTTGSRLTIMDFSKCSFLAKRCKTSSHEKLKSPKAEQSSNWGRKKSAAYMRSKFSPEGRGVRIKLWWQWVNTVFKHSVFPPKDEDEIWTLWVLSFE